MADKRIDQPTGTETMGHEWDGIEELNTPLPRWWLWAFYASIAWAAVYVVLYPAWPLVHSATAGTLGWTSTGQLEAELKQQRAARAPLMRAIAETPIEQLAQHPQLMQAAIEGGRAAFKVSCTQCHGSGAAGSRGYPNLNDDDWLWGGDIATIQYTIAHGVRQPDHDATRMSQMPAFGRDGILKADQIADLVAHVRTISHQQKLDAASARGAALFEQNCAACHGPDGKGNRAVGAPNLTDAIWLYGGDTETLTQTIANSRYGVMPRWGNHLDPLTIKMLAAYVHSLGGGEQAPKPELAAAGATDNGRP
jgi:cytochrome c oxidase cbb3-type subunit 3